MVYLLTSGLTLSVGCLIENVGERGIRLFGVDQKAKVADVIEVNRWNIRRRRGVGLQQALTAIQADPTPRVDVGPDRFLWQKGQKDFDSKFSLKNT